MCGAGNVAFTSKKFEMTIKKLTPQLAIDSKFFITHLPILVRSKTNAAVGAACALLRYWQLMPDCQLLYEMAL
jgi:hypothetical protein